MQLKAIIVEDEKHSRETLKNLLEIFCEGVVVVGLASSVKEALDIIPKSNVDVVFMDIELQSGTGFDILTQLPEINFEVIFTTAFDQYAIRAVKFSSLDYLLKPIDLDELKAAVEKAKKAKNKEEYNQQLKTLLQNIQQPKLSKICLATSEGFEFINTETILYCEAGGSYTTFVLSQGKKLLVSKHLKEYESLLTDNHFMRVHNSYLINLKEVKKYVKADGGYIVMNNNDIVSISRNKKDEFLEAMQLIA
jgi:two-component system LytT family response regulator